MARAERTSISTLRGRLRNVVGTIEVLEKELDQIVKLADPSANLDEHGEGRGPFPAVVILHSCGGFTSHVTNDWPSYLTGLDYVVLSVNTFGSRGYVRCPNPYHFDRATFVKDAYGALDYLAAQPFVDGNRIAVMGFSLGAVHPPEIIEFSGGPGEIAISVHWRNRVRCDPFEFSCFSEFSRGTRPSAKNTGAVGYQASHGLCRSYYLFCP